MTRKTLVRNIGWSMLNQVFARGSLTLAAIILARSFDMRDFAYFGYFQLTVAMFSTFSVLGLGTAASKIAAECIHRHHRDDEAMLRLLWLGSILLGATAAILILLLPNSWVGGRLHVPSWMISAGVFAAALQAVPNGAVLGLEEFRRAALNGMGGGTLVIAGALLAVTMPNIHIAIYTIIIGSFGIGSANTLLVFTRLGERRLIRVTQGAWPHIRHVFNLVLPLGAGSAVVTLGMWLVGRFLLDGEGGEYAFALYTIGMQWFALAMFVPANMGSVFLPRFVMSSAARSDGRAFLKKAVLAAMLVSVIVAIIGTISSPLLLRMYGHKYAGEISLIAAYLAAAVVTSPVTTLGNAMLAHDMQWARFLLFLGWLVILLIAAWWLRNVLVFGGAVPIAAAYGFTATAMYLLVRKRGLV
jgi:O-antigen/teichoic acid export membrane protein